ncbi:DUF72 domain-containing protein [Thermovibrio ammonificans]
MIGIGTCGYYYREWVGCFYPPGTPKSRWLEFYASRFNALEVNSTFYRPPSEGTVEKLKKSGLAVSLKLYRGITHEGVLSKENVEPFVEGAKLLGNQLKALLAQFPPDFKPAPGSKGLLQLLKERFGELLAVELRAPEWEEELPFLRELEVAAVFNFFPKSLRWPRVGTATKELAYFRLHGPKRLYTGSYSQEELREVALKVKKLPSEVKLVFFNNTRDCSAPKDAQRLKELLSHNGGNQEEQKGNDGN